MESQDVTGGGRPSRPAPRSRRGVRTRQALIAAAREVFERDGYLDARITDISKAAGVAAGSFYTYFTDKEEIFAALVEQVQEEMLHPHLRERTGVTGPRELIDAANREYLRSYERNARLMALFEQVAQIDEKFHRLRVERGNAFAERNAQMIRSLQERGEADPELDPLVTALSLSAMVGRMAYLYYVARIDITYDRLVTTLNRIWFNALDLGPSA
ncbi:TetR/AcrR family transcriptional regulator [Actinomadura opuntiae]|uniref:TetR/AcrR family transcriptional regulator n=1 Tax=Actinomadura sp. OS1-43 TaxID=604315 RepID=UPI00255A877B|nr:TetR/AcrR family transcriptional regulator [Actinomadura sp. OS1-43]MDL4813436.1 TetR/AcrR family transcriptional regulator [Actinomadura sp. OS1-43]